MDYARLNGRLFRAAVLLTPFACLLGVSLPYLLLLLRAVPSPAVLALAAAEHLLLLLGLTAVCRNLLVELLLWGVTDSGEGSVYRILYGGNRFFPLRSAVFVALFVAGYVLLTQLKPYASPLRALILLVPPVALWLNAPHFLSRRVRTVGGRCFLYDGRFRTVFSYFTDDNGLFCVITDAGKTVSTGVGVSSFDLGALEKAFGKDRQARKKPAEEEKEK